MRKIFNIYRQLDAMDCGPTCLRMISRYYGKHYSLQTLRQYSHITREGVSLKGISEAAVKLGFRTLSAKIDFEHLMKDAIFPCILHWNQKHFVVLTPENEYYKENEKIHVADPAHGLISVNKEAFLKSWISEEGKTGLILLLEPTPAFYESEEETVNKKGGAFLFKYLKPYKRYITQLFLGMFLTSILSLIAPFLSQSLVDTGISQQNEGFIYLVFIGQLALFLGNTAIEMIRTWILLHMSTRVNISIISDFLIKLMNLPIRYFDTKMVGDITQRIADHNRIEQFLTGASLSTIFSLVNLVVFSVVLGIYSIPILIVFFIGSAFSIGWILFFLKKRKELDYERFQNMSDNQNSLFEIITGMQEIKMNNSETMHRWSWERIQAKIFKISMKSLSLAQFQNIGSSFFSQLKNILISFMAARAVLSGNISLGMMLSVSYIIGQMNGPISQLLSFFQNAQDARISLERLSEIHTMKDEESEGELALDEELKLMMNRNELLPMDNGSKGVVLENVSFQYAGESSPLVLKNISLTIPFGKTTAIVGASGSGKTTLMKLLLKFYDSTSGDIYLGATSLKLISAKWWRKQCGVVMSDGFIFGNTIANNIAVSDEIDLHKLYHSVNVANIDSFISTLPLGYSTKIGNTGNGISSGQRQRILIARAIYKDVGFLFLDEATSTLDANNEKTIIENLQQYFRGRTVVVIAHRLSTVKHADQIVVMENGEIVELGDHKSLINQRGKYFELVKNQLELGN